MVHNGLQVDSSVHKMTLAISMLNNIFLLHAKTQDYHLKYPNVLI